MPARKEGSVATDLVFDCFSVYIYILYIYGSYMHILYVCICVYVGTIMLISLNLVIYSLIT